MYLSRLMLNPMSRRVQRELADVYQLHRSLLRSFPADMPDGERVLFRLEAPVPLGGEPRREDNAIPLLMQSQGEPRWDWLDDPGARGYLLAPPACKPFDLPLAAGQMLAFRLRANPTVKKDHDQPRADGKTTGRRVALYKEEDQLAWLERHAAASGFEVRGARTSGGDRLYGRAPPGQQQPLPVEGARSAGLRVFSVQFDGLLRVTDPVALTAAVRAGIGPAKAWGCGLLSLAVPR